MSRCWKKALSPATALAVVLALATSAVQAQEPPKATIDTTSPVPLLVDGVARTEFPLQVDLGTEVCAPQGPYYTSEGERYQFLEWRFVDRSSSSRCIRAVDPLTYTALFRREVLIKVVSNAPGVGGFQWAQAGSVATVEVPALVNQGEEARWRFEGWSEGLLPSSPSNQVVAIGPVTLTATYTPEFLVTVQAPPGVEVRGEGWYAKGAVATVQVPSSAVVEGQTLNFAGWEGEGVPASVLEKGSTVLTFSVTAPARLTALYQAPQAPVDSTPSTPATAVVGADAPVKLLVAGEPTETPATVPGGAEVCVPDRFVYTAEGERYQFLGWSSGAKDLCVTVDAGQHLTARFRHQVLLTITSEFRLMASTLWVNTGEPVKLHVPRIVEQAGVEWVFDQWMGGETPFNINNSIVVFEPTTLEVKFRKLYQVQVVSVHNVEVTGGGWYAEGEQALLRAPEVVEQGEGRRLRFVRWEQVGSAPVALPNLDSPEVSVPVTAPLTLQPVYAQEFLVEAENPQGVLTRTWVEAGKTLEVETPPVIEVIADEERLRFTHWQEDVPQAEPLAEIPKLVVPVKRPMRLVAVYRREFKVTLDAPYGGSGEGWYPENSVAVISVPPQPQAVLFLKKVFQGYAGYPQSGPVLQVVVRGPLKIGALYRNEVDYRVLMFIVGGLLVALIVWRVTEARMGARPAPAEAPEGEVVEEVVEEVELEDEEEEPEEGPPIRTSRPPEDYR